MGVVDAAPAEAADGPKKRRKTKANGAGKAFTAVLATEDELGEKGIAFQTPTPHL